MNTSGKLCPICNHENESTATVCARCGASWLEEKPTRIVAIPEVFRGQINTAADHMGSPIDVSLIPEESLGIYIAGELQPFYVQIYRELIIGRPADAALEAVLDLTELNAANHGVSKRHAMIRRSASGFEVLDLGSRNGTWLEGERLIPNKPYPLASGSQLRLGQMRLRVMYHPVLKNAKKG